MIDSRAAAHHLHEIVALLELQGEDPAVPAPFADAARALAADEARPLADLLARDRRRFAPEVLEVLEDLGATGDSTLLDRLRESTPEGLFEMLRVPGLGPSRIRRIHEGLGIDTLQALEAAARDGRLAALPRFGARTAEQVQRGIAWLKESGTPVLLPHGRGVELRLIGQLERAAVGAAEMRDLEREAAMCSARLEFGQVRLAPGRPHPRHHERLRRHAVEDEPQAV
ncbi:MAG: helix-hairpin-helix domain-containing protein, partial [Gemmatimonadota bacterium]